MKLSQAKLEIIRRFFREKLYVKNVKLYGSYATGHAVESSDIDLLIKLDYSQDLPDSSFIFSFGASLAQKLGVRVSVVTTQGLSEHIRKSIEAGELITIYDVEIKGNAIGEIEDDYFDYALYRDKAKLLHIDDSLERIFEWIRNDGREKYLADEKTQSACLRELSLIAHVANSLSKSALEEIFSEFSQSLSGYHSFSEYLRVIGAGTGAYLGVDHHLLWNFFEKDLKKIARAIGQCLAGWDERFRSKLVNHYTNILTSNLTPMITRLGDYDERLDLVRDKMKTTISSTPPESLNLGMVKAGERNVALFAFQINTKGSWDNIFEGFCPFFPFC